MFAIRNVFLRLALRGVLLWFAPSVAFAYVYEVRVWRSTDPVATLYGCAYRNTSELYSRFSQQFTKLPCEFSGSYAVSSSGKCPLFEPVGGNKHLVLSCVPGVASGYVWKRNDSDYYMVAHSMYPAVYHTITNAVTWNIYACRKCVTGSDSMVKHIYCSPSTVTCNSENFPIWAFYSDKIKNVVPIYNEDGDQIIGGSWDIKPSAYPPGAIGSGEMQNGDWILGEDDLEWQYYPGKEPQIPAAQMSEILSAFQTSLDSLVGKQPPEGFFVDLGDNLTGWVNSAVDDALGAGGVDLSGLFSDLKAAINAAKPDPPDYFAILSAINAVKSSVDNVKADTALIKGKLDTANTHLTAVNSKLEIANTTLTSVDTGISGVNSWLGDFREEYDKNQSKLFGAFAFTNSLFGSVNDSIWLDIPEFDQSADLTNYDAALNEKLGDVVAVIETGDSYFASIVETVSGMLNALIGNWASLGRETPNFTLSLELPIMGTWNFNINFSVYDSLITFFRYFCQVMLALWLMFEVWKLLLKVGE